MARSAASDAPKEPIDTTGDADLEAKWQALVGAVVDAKAAAQEAKLAWADACAARGSILTATPEAAAAADEAKAAYDEACKTVDEAAARMKAGDL